MDSISQANALEEEDYNPITSKQDGNETQQTHNQPAQQQPPTNPLKMAGQLEALFQDLCFCFIAKNELKELFRYAIAYDAEVVDVKKATYIICEEKQWNDEMENAFKQNPKAKFLRSSWVWECVNGSQLLPIQKYLIERKSK